VGTRALIIWKTVLILTVYLRRLIVFFIRDTHLYRARFARFDEVARLLSPVASPTSLILGTSQSGDFVSVTPTKTRRELGNVLVVAPTRGGKGLLAVSQLLTWRHSVIVNDIKGDLFTQTAGYRRSLGPVFVIDPQGIGHSYDPLHENQTEDEFLSASARLLHQANEGDGAIFTQRAMVMLTQMFLASRLEKMAPLPYARFLIRLGFADTAARLDTLSPMLATQFLDISYLKANLTDRFLLSSWGTLTARMRPLLTETLIRSLTHPDFTAEEIMCSPKPITVYLRWTEKDLLALSPMIRLIWGSIIDGLITIYDQKKGRECNPVLLLVDEAGRTAIPMLADHATTVVGRGISLWVAVQSLSQLDTVYGKARSLTLQDNMESQLYYRPSNLQTAEYLERCLGRRSEYAHSKTTREGGDGSTGLSEQAVPLMPAGDILQMTDTEVVGFHRNLPPMRLTRMDWRQHSQLVQRRDIPPPRLTALPPLTELQLRNTDPLIDDDLVDPDKIN
jgi:type IV secretion system protein VirD4